MSDVHQWRRMLPPLNPLSRPRTPQIQAIPEVEEYREYRSDLSDSGSIVSASTYMPETKPGKKPKLFHRASQYLVAATSGKHQPVPPFGRDYFNDVEPQKDFQWAGVEQIIGSVFEELATNVCKPLSVQNNAPLLRVFEAYKALKAERDELSQKLIEAIAHNNTTLDTLEGERKRWKEDEINYKAEIKRLEVLIAKGKTGLSEVILARQQSLIRRGKEARAFKQKDQRGQNSVPRHAHSKARGDSTVSVIPKSERAGLYKR